MKYRVDYTLRIDGLEHESCHYCSTLDKVNELLSWLEERGAWGIQVYDTNLSGLQD